MENAMILAAGRGKRMGDLTLETPKPMVHVHGRPILEWIIEGMAHAGIRRILVITGYLAEVIESHFGDGSAWNVAITYRHQQVQDGTGRVVELGRDMLQHAPFLLSYGDIVTSPANYPRLVEAAEGSDGVLSVVRGEDVSKGGAIFIDQDFRVTGLCEKPQPGEPTSPWYNAGVYAFAPCLFDYLPRLQPSIRGEYELTDAIRMMVDDGRVMKALELEGGWADVRDPEVLEQLNRPTSTQA